MHSQETAQPNLQIQTWHIDKLVFYARNPRKNDAAVDRMCSSIRPSLGSDRRSKRIIAGKAGSTGERKAHSSKGTLEAGRDL